MRGKHQQVRARIHHEVSLVIAIEDVLHLRQLGKPDQKFDGPQLFHVLDLFHRLRADSEGVWSNGEQDHVFPVAAAFALLFFEEPHSAPTLLAPKTYITRFSTAVKILSMPSTWSTAPVLMASCGMPKMMEVASSCATTYPPAVFTFCTPTMPSLPMPVRITPMLIGPANAAAVSSVTSAHGR